MKFYITRHPGDRDGDIIEAESMTLNAGCLLFVGENGALVCALAPGQWARVEPYVEAPRMNKGAEVPDDMKPGGVRYVEKSALC